MTILDEIIEYKKFEVKNRKSEIPFRHLENTENFSRVPIPLTDFLLDKTKSGIIAEFKRKSPSKGIINEIADVELVSNVYTKNGASGLSVLTDTKYFGGSDEDLVKTREINDIPILRKEFIIDEYQVIESKSIGADVILLIAACLKEKEIYKLAKLAVELDLQVLMEVHTDEELQLCNEFLHVVGVNNRNLKTFKVDIQTSINLSEKIPPMFLKISESGISNPESITKLKQKGFNGFLIGEHFMKEKNPGKAFEDFVKKIKS